LFWCRRGGKARLDGRTGGKTSQAVLIRRGRRGGRNRRKKRHPGQDREAGGGK